MQGQEDRNVLFPYKKYPSIQKYKGTKYCGRVSDAAAGEHVGDIAIKKKSVLDHESVTGVAETRRGCPWCVKQVSQVNDL